MLGDEAGVVQWDEVVLQEGVVYRVLDKVVVWDEVVVLDEHVVVQV